MNENQSELMLHPAETLIAAYAIGRCSAEEQAKIDEHCFVCEDCRTRLSILLRVSATDASDIERQQLERLFPLGMETIAQARQIGGLSVNQTNVKNRPSALNHPLASPIKTASIFDSSIKRFGQKRSHIAIAVVVIVAIAGVFAYQYVQRRSPVQNSLMAMQRSYKSNRPLEARVTGGFDYHPYEPKRGNNDSADIDRDQINYALAELTNAVALHPNSETRHALGRLYLLLGEFDKAEFQMVEALRDSPKNAKLYTDLAALYYEKSKYTDTVTLLSKAVEHYDAAIKIEPNLAEAWFNRALCKEGLALKDQAAQDWEKYLEIDGKSPWASEARTRLKKLKLKAVNSGYGKKEIDGALQKAAEANNEEDLRQLVGKNFAAAEQFSTGEIFDNYLSAALAQNDQLAESYLVKIRRVGRSLAEAKGDHSVSDLADFASRASPEVKNNLQSVRLMLRQADKEFERSSQDAFKLSLSAYQLAEQIGDQYHTEIAFLKLLRIPNLPAKYGQLTTKATQLVSQTERNHHLQLQAQTHIAIANVYLGLRQNTLALENSLRATEIAKKLGDTDLAINSIRFSSGAYARSGDYERALEKNFEVLSLLRDQPISPLRRLQAYHQVGETFFILGNYPMALAYQQEALQIAIAQDKPLPLAGTKGRVGLTLWKLGRNDEAKPYLDDAISKMKLVEDQATGQLLQTELYTTLGDVFLDQGKTDESILAYNQAKGSLQDTNNRVYLSAIHQGLAAAYLKQGKSAKAESELQTSISLVERDRKQIGDIGGRSAFLASRQNIYQEMIDFQYNVKHSPTAAFNFAENAKSRNLLDTLSQKTSVKWRDGRIVLSLAGNAQPLTLKQVQYSLPHNLQLLSYTITEKKLLIWLVTNKDVSTVSVEISAEQLQKLVSAYFSALRSRRDIDVVNRQASELYRLLILPLTDKLDQNRLLCVVPDGVLYQLPFGALFSPVSNRYLIEDFSITLNPSASVLIGTSKLAAAKRGNNAENLIGVGNPRFSYKRFPGLPTLPSSEEEITRIRPLYSQSEFLNNENATETALIQSIGQHEIVHIATHILVNGQLPLQSSILLAEESPQSSKPNPHSELALDGTLQALEIYQLKLPRTKLVILSGCQSAVGDYTRGEALSLLAQSFFAAKVPAVIASLWEVDDAASAEIMYSFHYNHRVKHQGFADALSAALRSRIYGTDIKQRHPYYWAAYLLSGSGLDNSAGLN